MAIGVVAVLNLAGCTIADRAQYGAHGTVAFGPFGMAPGQRNGPIDVALSTPSPAELSHLGLTLDLVGENDTEVWCDLDLYIVLEPVAGKRAPPAPVVQSVRVPPGPFDLELVTIHNTTQRDLHLVLRLEGDGDVELDGILDVSATFIDDPGSDELAVELK